MSRSVQRPPIHGRGYSVREVTSVGAGSGLLSKRPPPAPPSRPPPSPPRPGVAAGGWLDRPGVAFSCSIGAATRALATSVRRPIWWCHHPLHAIEPSQKFVYVEL